MSKNRLFSWGMVLFLSTAYLIKSFFSGDPSDSIASSIFVAASFIIGAM